MKMEDIVITVTRHDEQISSLKKWQKKQNGSLQVIDEKLNRFYFWLIGLMGGMITSLVLLIANILILRK